MNGVLIAMWLMSPEQKLRGPAFATPNTIATPGASEARRKLAEAQELLAQAEKVRAGYAPASGQPTLAELNGSIDQIKSNPDSMSEMGEMQSLRLQMSLDRMSKMMSTLSPA